MDISSLIYLAVGFFFGLYIGSKSFREKVNAFLKLKKAKGRDK